MTVTRGIVKEDFYESSLALVRPISSLQNIRNSSLNHGTGYDFKTLILQGSMKKNTSTAKHKNITSH